MIQMVMVELVITITIIMVIMVILWCYFGYMMVIRSKNFSRKWFLMKKSYNNTKKQSNHH